MSNGSNNLYDRLSRLLRLVQRHENQPIEYYYKKGLRIVKETRHWKMVNYFTKMLNDGMIWVNTDNTISILEGDQ